MKTIELRYDQARKVTTVHLGGELVSKAAGDEAEERRGSRLGN
jgi:hypothetical protein